MCGRAAGASSPVSPRTVSCLLDSAALRSQTLAAAARCCDIESAWSSSRRCPNVLSYRLGQGALTMDSVRAGGTAARVIVGIVLALLASAAQAQPSQQQISAVKASCRSDFMAHCMSVQPGTREALQCLQQHLAQLSGACKTAVNATMPQAPVAAPAPRAAAAPAPAAKTATTPPSEPPAAIATPAVPPPAHKAATTRSKPVKQPSAPPPTASSSPPTSPAQENGPVPGGLLVDK